MDPQLAGAAGQGIISLYQYGGVVTLLVLMCFGMAGVIVLLYKRNILLSDKMMDVINQNTVAITTLTAVINANSK